MAGSIALLIHRQRLRHEREEADLTLVRKLLADGTEMVDRTVQAAKGPLLVPDEPDYAAYRRALGDSAEKTGAYGLRLRVLFVENHEVRVAWATFIESSAALTDTLIEAARTQQGGHRVDRATVEKAVERVDAAATSWVAAATRVARARLRDPDGDPGGDPPTGLLETSGTAALGAHRPSRHGCRFSSL